MSCDPQGVNILIDMGADVNSYEDTDQSPICLAVQNNNHFMVLNLLAEVGVASNRECGYNSVLLHVGRSLCYQSIEHCQAQ